MLQLTLDSVNLSPNPDSDPLFVTSPFLGLSVLICKMTVELGGLCCLLQMFIHDPIIKGLGGIVGSRGRRGYFKGSEKRRVLNL